MTYSAVVDHFPGIFEIDERLSDALEARQLIQPTDLIPRDRRQPSCWITVWIVEADATSQ